jgi:hypothetical protein
MATYLYAGSTLPAAPEDCLRAWHGPDYLSEVWMAERKTLSTQWFYRSCDGIVIAGSISLPLLPPPLFPARLDEGHIGFNRACRQFMGFQLRIMWIGEITSSATIELTRIC